MLWKEIWESHRGRVVGIAGGILYGIIYLMFGFWDMLFFALVVFIGYTAGRRKDQNEGPFFRWKVMGQWLSERWRLFK
ncbi:DUF2273 domain-containing protein [Paenibacillus pini]|uniref:Small integral membrane protein n=1 Tax=Paenibacillus pini JCM 16418 TaxID=1236976 RepID=W7Z388_9BACL|nr:DUF2273 domain-containing protein [Paenibacillus pini]GAF08939.1 hypothetical protein JCM16418_3050 [Paenibacillus pini JCM 16418]